MLGDAAGLAGRDFGRANGVEQRRLAVIDVAHDGDDRRARLQVGRIVRRIEHALFDVGFGNAPHGVAEFFGDELRGIGVDRVGDLRHVTLLHEDADHVDAALGHAVGQFLNGDRFGDSHFARDLFLRLVAVAGHALYAAAERSDRTFAYLIGRKGGDDRKPAAALFGADARRLRRRRGTCGRAAGATAGARRLVFVGFERRPGARLGRRYLGAEALLGDFVGLLLGVFVVLAAFFFFALARFGRGALGAIDFFAGCCERALLPRRARAPRFRAPARRRAHVRAHCAHRR